MRYISIPITFGKGSSFSVRRVGFLSSVITLLMGHPIREKQTRMVVRPSPSTPSWFSLVLLVWLGFLCLCGLHGLWLPRLELLGFPFLEPLVHSLFEFLHEGDEAVHLVWHYFDLLVALWVWPIFDLDHGALLRPGLKRELFFPSIHVEADLSSSNIDHCSSSAQQWPPEDEQGFFGYIHVEHHKVDKDEVVPNLHWNIVLMHSGWRDALLSV
jgi:hypothetical protein